MRSELYNPWPSESAWLACNRLSVGNTARSKVWMYVACLAKYFFINLIAIDNHINFIDTDNQHSMMIFLGCYYNRVDTAMLCNIFARHSILVSFTSICIDM